MPVRLSQTFGPNAVDWENRVDMGRLREERLARLNAELERSELGALLSFDFANIRYMTSTHIGTWAMDKLIRFALLPRGGKPDRLGLRLGGAPSPALQPLAGPHRRPGHPGGRGPDRRAGRDLDAARGLPPGRGDRRGRRGQDRGGAARARAGRRAARRSTWPRCRCSPRWPPPGSPSTDGQQVFMEARRIKTRDEITPAVPGVRDGRRRLRRAVRVPAARRARERVRRPGQQGPVRPGQRVRGGRERDLRRALLAAPARVLRPADPARATRRSSTSCTATTATGPATTGRSPSAARRGRSGTPTRAAASTWTRRSRSSSRARPRPTSSRCGRGRASSASPTRRPRSACSTGTASACPSGRSRSSAGWCRSTTRSRWRRAWSSRWRPTGRPATAGRRRGSRRNWSSPRTAARSSPSSRPRSCWWRGASTGPRAER